LPLSLAGRDFRVLDDTEKIKQSVYTFGTFYSVCHLPAAFWQNCNFFANGAKDTLLKVKPDRAGRWTASRGRRKAGYALAVRAG